MPPGSEEVVRAAAASHDWAIVIASVMLLAAMGASAVWLKSTSKVAADSITANAKLVEQYFQASEAREARMGERITTLENENRATLAKMSAQMATALADSSNAIKTINGTMSELVRETRAQTGMIGKAAGEVHEVAASASGTNLGKNK